MLPEYPIGKADHTRVVLWRPDDYPYLEIIDGPPLAYHGSLRLHEDLEIAWKPYGSWNTIIRGSRYTITSDTVVVMPPEEPHTPASNPADNGRYSRYIGLRIQTVMLSNLVAEISNHSDESLFHFSTSFIRDPGFRAQLFRLHRGLVRNDLPRLEQDVLIQQLMTEMLRYSKALPDLPRSGGERLVVEKVKSYIRDHYQEQIPLQQLAHVANMSAFHLNHVFGLRIGMPPHAYQIQIRISRAKRLLTQGHSIADVALQTGFTSQSHFGLYFKRIVSVTPGQYLADTQTSLPQTART